MSRHLRASRFNRHSLAKLGMGRRSKPQDRYVAAAKAKGKSRKAGGHNA
jgi:hypothetical protein